MSRDIETRDEKPRLSEWLFRLALLAFPRAFRVQHGPGMHAAFTRRHANRERSASSMLSIVVTLADTVINGARVRFADSVRGIRSALQGGNMRGWLSEIGIILRGLRRRPVFTVQTVLTVALGTVGVAAVYPILHQVVLRPLPYEDPDRLVTVRSTLDEQLLGVTIPELFHLSQQQDLFEGVGAVLQQHYHSTIIWTHGSQREPLHTIRATPGLMGVLGVDLTGPGFDASRDKPYQVILGHSFWTSRFGRDPSILGSTISLNDRPHTVVGILPETFEFPLSAEPYDLWAVVHLDPATPPSTDNRIFQPVARLRADASVARVRNRIPDQLRAFHEREATGIHIQDVFVRTLHEDLVGSVRTPLLLLTGAAGLVLVIAALNVSLLIATRNLARQRELAVRRAIGAGRGRVARLLLTEAGVIALLGTLAGGVASGLVFSWIASGGGLQIVRADTSWGADVWRSIPALLGVLAVAFLTALVPAIRASRPEPLTSRSHDVTRGVRNAISWVIGAESALVFGLLVAAGLTLVSLDALTRVDPGFEPTGAAAIELQVPRDGYEGDEAARLFQAAEERLASLPGISSAGAITHLPLDANNWGGAFAIEGRTDPPPDALPTVDWEFASPGYFEAAGIPIVEGRPFTAADTWEAPLVAIINETLARRYWPNGGAVGSRANGNGFDGTWFTIVGVARDVKQEGLEVESRGYFYMASLQDPYGFGFERQMVVRTESADALAFVPDIRRALVDLEPRLTIGSVTSLEDLVHNASGAFRLRAALFGTFGLIAALLGMAGIYGVVSHGVQARKHEVGIRLAVGANANGIFRMVIVDGLRPVLLGIVGGVALVFVASRWLSAFVFGIEPGSPVVMGGIAAVLIGAALGAILPAALRARGLDPVRVLQSE